MNKMETGIKESELDRKSLEMLGEYDVVIGRTGVFVMFKSQSLSLSEREYKALFEFGQDNNLHLCEVCIGIGENSFRATACYPSGEYIEGDHEDGWFEGLDEMGEQE